MDVIEPETEAIETVHCLMKAAQGDSQAIAIGFKLVQAHYEDYLFDLNDLFSFHQEYGRFEVGQPHPYELSKQDKKTYKDIARAGLKNSSAPRKKRQEEINHQRLVNEIMAYRFACAEQVLNSEVVFDLASQLVVTADDILQDYKACKEQQVVDGHQNRQSFNTMRAQVETIFTVLEKTPVCSRGLQAAFENASDMSDLERQVDKLDLQRRIAAVKENIRNENDVIVISERDKKNADRPLPNNTLSFNEAIRERYRVRATKPSPRSWASNNADSASIVGEIIGKGKYSMAPKRFYPITAESTQTEPQPPHSTHSETKSPPESAEKLKRRTVVSLGVEFRRPLHLAPTQASMEQEHPLATVHHLPQPNQSQSTQRPEGPQ